MSEGTTRLRADDIDWTTVDKWLTGEAFVGSRLDEFLYDICERIGPRWAGTEGDFAAGANIKERFQEFGLANPRSEEFALKAWDFAKCQGRVDEEERPITLVPMIHCPPIDVRAPLVDVGFGMPHELQQVAGELSGSVAIVNVADEPFSPIVSLPERFRDLAKAGCVAAISVEPRAGGHIETIRATDKRWNEKAGDVLPHPLPTVQTHREDGVRLRRSVGKTIEIKVEGRSFSAPCYNTVADLPGQSWPDESLVLGAHQDTYMGSPGAGKSRTPGICRARPTAPWGRAKTEARRQSRQGAHPRAEGVRRAAGADAYQTFAHQSGQLAGHARFGRRHRGQTAARDWYRL